MEAPGAMEERVYVRAVLRHPRGPRVQQLGVVHAPRATSYFHEASPQFRYQIGMGVSHSYSMFEWKENNVIPFFSDRILSGRLFHTSFCGRSASS